MIKQPTMSLRWIERNGKKILQQLWVFVEHKGIYRNYISSEDEWRDVPSKETWPPE